MGASSSSPHALAPSRKRAQSAIPRAHGDLLILCARFSHPAYPCHAITDTNSHLQGGDNSDGAAGAFFEGVVLKGASTESADAEVQADITAFYSKASLAGAK